MFGFGKKKEQTKTSEGNYLVTVDRKNCIGADVCEAMAPKHFLVDEGKKVVLKDSTPIENGYEKRIGEEDLTEVLQAAQGCPPKVIRVKNTQTGEELVKGD